MAQQTAVEWLIERFLLNDENIMQVMIKAKIMEKEQIVNAYENGSDVNDDLKPLYGTPEEYYNQTYNK
jgi:hypothetical protein